MGKPRHIEQDCHLVAQLQRPFLLNSSKRLPDVGGLQADYEFSVAPGQYYTIDIKFLVFQCSVIIPYHFYGVSSASSYALAMAKEAFPKHSQWYHNKYIKLRYDCYV